MLSPLAPPSPATATRRRRAADRGFTLIELMIAIVVLGILAAVAFPSYMDSVRKSRRSEAMTALAQAQQAQERWRGNNSAYTTALSDLAVSATTPSGYYAISLSAAPGSPAPPLATAYVAMAYGAAGTSQANDAQCRRLAVRLLDGNLTYAGCGSCASFGAADFTATHACWPQ